MSMLKCTKKGGIMQYVLARKLNITGQQMTVFLFLPRQPLSITFWI